MRRLGAVAVGLLCFAGCGPEPCGPWAAQYDVRCDERPSGLCGPVPDTVSTFTALSTTCGRCTGTTYATECEIVIDETNGSGRARGTLSQVDGPGRLEGVLSLSLYAEDGSVVCISTYDVTALAL